MARGRPLLRSPRKIADNRSDFMPPKEAEYVRDWTTLTPGEDVYIVENDGLESCGRVDAVTGDGSILWLYMDGGAGRRLFTRSDGDLVWSVPANAQ